jgi:predicted HTH transcriptional regulator
MPVFLHEPIADGSKIAELVAARAEEGQQLEFKPDLNDSAKEVAALANAIGGDLIIGVS